MQSNRRPANLLCFTHEGASTINPLTPIQQLRRTLLTCLLFEDTAYESGQSIKDRIVSLVPQCGIDEVCQLAIESRHTHNLRHVPLLLLRELLRRKPGRIVGDTIAEVISRPDELTELVAMYWAGSGEAATGNGSNGGTKRKMLPKQLRIGLSRAFRKFDEYQLAKYNRDNPVKLRDVLFMAHAKPSKDKEDLYRRLVDGQLKTPDTWETRLSAGEDKQEAWETLLKENKLGALALLRNLRNMEQAGISPDLISQALRDARFDKVLPFRFLAAFRSVQNPDIKEALNRAMLKSMNGLDTLPGRTLVLVDVSGSMDARLAGKTDMNRMDAACGLAILLRGVCEACHVATFSNHVVSVDNVEGIPLADAILKSQMHGGTMMGNAIHVVHEALYDRLIVITDEQSADRIPNAKPDTREYIINVAPYQNGVGYTGGYIKIDGFSEATIKYIQLLESEMVE